MAYSSITKPSDYFNTVLYTGNGTTNHAITGVGFQPDLNWIKKRSTADNHIIHYVGLNAGDYIRSNTTDGLSNSGEMTKSLDSDGFTVGTRGEVNTNNSTFASWNWKANGAGSSNTDGTITSTVSANTTAGFSIVSYTGTGAAATVGHGLGATPKMIIVKNRDSAENWGVWHTTIGANEYLGLNQTGAKATNTAIWNNTLPTSSVFSVGNNARTGTSADFIAYCFAEKKGYSKMGTYTGNGNANGPFCYTGFKPAFVIGKRTDSAGGWWLSDNKRSNGFNLNDEYLIADSSNAEQNDGSFASDFLSNGWKARATNGNFNASGGSYIYMAFAEHPLVANINGGLPATAR